MADIVKNQGESGSVTVPEGVYSYSFEMVAPGGTGGSGNYDSFGNTNVGGGGAGGGGTYAGSAVSTSPGTSLSYDLNSSTANFAVNTCYAGNNGQDASGSGSGSYGNGGSGGGSGGYGYTGSSGDSSSGGSGGNAGSGVSFYGSGGSTSYGSGNNGSNYGGGGSGGYGTGNNGGSGAPGRLEITWGSTTYPNDPSGIGIDTITTTSARVTWYDNSSIEDNYYIEVVPTSSMFSNYPTYTASSNATSQSLTSLTPNTHYKVQVWAVHSGYASGAISTDFTTDNAPPDAPSGAYVNSISFTSATLNWTDNSSTEDGYKIYITTYGGSYGGSPDYTTSPNYTSTALTSLTANTHYKVKVYSYNSAGESSSYSETDFYTLGPPDAPSGAYVTSISFTSATLNWTDNSSDEDGFTIYVADYSGSYTSPGYPTTSVSSNYTSTALTSLTANTYYKVKIHSWNVAGESSSYSETYFYTLGPPTAPSNIGIDTITTYSANVTWTDNSSDEDGFKIYVAYYSGSYSGTPDYTTSSNATSQSLSFGPETHYKVKVHSYNDGGLSSSYIETDFWPSPFGPGIISVSWNGDEPILNFSDNSNIEDGFRFYLAENSGSYSGHTDVGSPSLSSYNLSAIASNLSVTLSIGTLYKVKISAYKSGGGESDTSETTFYYEPTPTTFSASDNSPTAKDLGWANSSTTNLELEVNLYSDSFSSDFSGITNGSHYGYSLSPGVTTQTISNLTPGTHYKARIRHHDVDNGLYSDFVVTDFTSENTFIPGNYFGLMG